MWAINKLIVVGVYLRIQRYKSHTVSTALSMPVATPLQVVNKGQLLSVNYYTNPYIINTDILT